MNDQPFFNTVRRFAFLLWPVLMTVDPAHGDALAGKDLAAALHAGGYVILMRHASSPRTAPMQRKPMQITCNTNVSWMRKADPPRATWETHCGVCRYRLAKYYRAPPIAHWSPSNLHGWVSRPLSSNSAIQVRA